MPKKPFGKRSIMDAISSIRQKDTGSVFACNLERQMREPAVGCRAMPVLYIGRNVNDRSGQNLYRRFALFLIPAAPGHTDKHLSAAFRGFMDVPVVAAARAVVPVAEK